MDEAFLRFCQQHGIEPNDERRVFWLGALQSTREQLPVAWGCFGADGTLLSILDAIPVHMRPRPVPLYKSPVANVPKAPLTREVIDFIWREYYAADGDIEGMVRFVERHCKAP